MRHGLVKKYSLKHLKDFSCDVFVHVPKEYRSNIDNKDEKCVFIGHKYGIKGYKLWKPITKTIYS
jgi:hypothetical protein